jgi:RNA polymerase sigma-70 factor (ECF subfamily)
VLGHSVDEISALLGMNVPAVKAALHRGRVGLRAGSGAAASTEPSAAERPQTRPSAPRRTSPEIARYASLFNARDWDGVRAMLAEDVRLDLVSRSQRAGRRDVSGYFANYDAFGGWYLVPAWLEGREVVAVFRDPPGARPAYFVEVTFAGGRVAAIKDFRYVPYIAADAEISDAAGGPVRASV